MKNKRADIGKDCTRFDLRDPYTYFKKKLSEHKNPKIHHLAQATFYLYMRLKRSKDGISICVTCGKRLPRNSPDMHPGHFKPAGQSLKYKYVEDNIFSQCNYCNVMLNGNYSKYTLYMIDKFGRERVDNILSDNSTFSIKNYQYAKIINDARAYLDANYINKNL